jgi:hypothetical protein
MASILVDIEKLALAAGLEVGLSTNTIGEKLTMKVKVLKSISKEIELVRERKNTMVLTRGDKKIKEVRFYRHVENNKLEVCVKYKGKKITTMPKGKSIKCENDYQSLIKTLELLKGIYDGIDENNEFYMGIKE